MALIHIYCGDGKGKTTASVGLTTRMSGAGKRVVFSQFFKAGDSSEIASLRLLPNVKIMHCNTVKGRWARLNDEEKKIATRDYTAFLDEIFEAAKDADLLVLDEIISSCNNGAVPEEKVIRFLETKSDDLEVVLTGRNPSDALIDHADYVTEMKKIKHPFDEGIPARFGIEF